MIAAEGAAARAIRMDRPTAEQWVRVVGDALVAGWVSYRFGDEVQLLLELHGFFDLAASVRAAAQARAALMRARGFSPKNRETR